MQLRGKRVLITAGPTVEAIDPVRFISNHSSGKQGYAIAAACVAMGAEEVVLVSGPTTIPAPESVQLVRVRSADEMLEACEMTLPVDIAICTAAVCDWRTQNVAQQKLKKQQGQESLTLELVRNVDILATLSQHANRPPVVIGFAAETENHEENARKKLAAKGCDGIVVNDVSSASAVFGGDENHLKLLLNNQDDLVDLGKGTKAALAEKLLHTLEKHLV